MDSTPMTTLATEIEFKFAVRDQSAFAALVAHLGLPSSVLDDPVLQINHFFDTARASLRTNGLAIRLREQAGAYYFTIKGGKSSRSEDGVLSSRIEEERLLETQTARAMLNATIPVLTVIAQHFTDSSSQLVDRIEELIADQALVYAGKFENRRITLPPITLAIAGFTRQVEFELDSIAFPDKTSQFEIEVEVASSEDAHLIHDELVALLSAAGIEWSTTESKAARFFEIVDKNRV
jgi:uncharacterized protein YjbK